MAGQVLDGGVNDQQPLLADTVHACRFCASPLRLELIDLGVSPLCERFLRPDQLDEMEPFYPLRVEVCETCFLAQIPAYVSPAAIFSEYAYFSSYSDSWLAHAAQFATEMVGRCGLTSESLVVEVGSNDGYLLRDFVARGIPALGIEPAAERRPGCREPGRPDDRTVLRREPSRGSSRPPDAAPTCSSAITSWPRCPTSTTSSVASRSCSPTTASSRSRCRTCSGSWPTTSSTRSTTSTSRTSRCSPCAGSSPPMA